MLQFPALTSQTCADMNKNFNRVVFHSINIIRSSRIYKKSLRVLKKLTQGRRLWHGLHGLKVKLIKISPEWSLVSLAKYIFSDMYVAFRHGLHGLTNNLQRVIKKLTQGRRFWHGLHGLRIKVLKISPGWSFTSIREQTF